MTAPVHQPAGNAPPAQRPTTGGFAFGTKGETLERLRPMIASAKFCDQTIVPVARWFADPAAVTAEILDRFDGQALAVRSSSSMEDGWQESGAGALASVTGVGPAPAPLSDAIRHVIASYGAGADGQQVLVQPMVENVALSGVVLTRDLDTGGPYYVIDYDDFSGRTDTVTGGAESKTVLVHRTNPEALHSPRMRAIINAVREIEAVTGNDRLDIEFCVTERIEVFILQVRPLAASRRWQIVPDETIDETIAEVRRRVATLQQPVADLAGSTTILGEMPDWNPAEMIGNTPRRLAYSLYAHLITERTWAEARARMGYRDVGYPLMLELAGRPYIDVRLSLNSFLPADLPAEVAEHVVNAALNTLGAQPDLHDKIEFDVAFTCRDANFTQRAAAARETGLSDSDISQLGATLGALTARCVENGMDQIVRLLARTRRLLELPPPGGDDFPQEIGALLRRTASDGTLPFAMLARHAFIGAAFLRSLVSRGALEPDAADRFMRSIHTVAGEVVEAMARVADGKLDKDGFLRRYGHLRPGTYDILSCRYDERPDLYLGQRGRPPPESESFELTAKQRTAIAGCLAEEGFAFEPDLLLSYISAAISAREESKFAFSRGVSDALVAALRWADECGLSRDELSHLDISDVLDSPADPGRLREKASEAARRHLVTRAIRLPHLIVEPDDLDVVRPLRGRATFITGRSVTAPTIHLASTDISRIDGRIVLIESADPGYDWIFSHEIVGLVTKFGGTNSHMAIRCAEFALPAAIGCGERLFGELLKSPVVELDCANRRLIGH